MKRKGLSKKLRFEIFKRDSFKCQYCGATPPSVVLEVDHISPVSKGGENDIDNLVTSCFDCNRGKGANSLDCIPDTLVQKTAVAKEKEAQLKEFNKLKSAIKTRKTKQTNKVAASFEEFFPGRSLTDKAKLSIKIQFLPHLDVETLIDNMESACSRFDSDHDAFKYFCGICWNMIKDRGRY